MQHQGHLIFSEHELVKKFTFAVSSCDELLVTNQQLIVSIFA